MMAFTSSFESATEIDEDDANDSAERSNSKRSPTLSQAY